jgi:dihydrofolate reductase
MTKIIYYVASSLDGYIATQDGGVDWLSAYNTTEEDYGYAAFFDSVDGLIEGSRTYEQALSFGEWPHPGKPCWVCTHRHIESKHPEVTFTQASPSELVSELRRLGLGRVWLVGGGQLAASFRAQGLIDEYIVSVIPTVLGSGISLFGSPGPQENLKLVECKPYAGGLVQLHYLRERTA